MLFASPGIALILANAMGGSSEVTLRFHPRVGKTYRYHLSTNIRINPETGSNLGPPVEDPRMSMGVEVDLDMEVLSQAADMTMVAATSKNANVILLDGAEAGMVSLAGWARPASPLAPLKPEIAEMLSSLKGTCLLDGRYARHGVGGSALASILENAINIQFPAHAVRPGDSWESTVDMAKMLGGMMAGLSDDATINGTIPIKFRLRKVSHKGATTVADIGVELKGDVAIGYDAKTVGEQMESRGVVEIDTATGTIVWFQMTENAAMSGSSMYGTQRTFQMMKLRD